MEPMALPRNDGTATAAAPKQEFRPVYVEGTFHHDKEVLVGPRGPPPGAISATGPNSGRSSGGMSSSPQVGACEGKIVSFDYGQRMKKSYQRFYGRDIM